MFTSLRTRLLAWYTTVLALVIVVFGAAVCYLAWRNRLAHVDGLLRVRAEVLAAGIRPAPGGAFDVTLPPPASPVHPGEAPPYHVIWTPDGITIDRSDPDRVGQLPVAPGVRTHAGRREVTVRTAAGPHVLVGSDLAQLRDDIRTLAGMMAAVAAGALGVAMAGGWLLVGRALAPIERISRTARRMVDGDFAARIPIHRVETELGQVAHALNEAFDRLHAALERQRRFTADASHELRTPLATLSTETQWALARERAPAEYRESLASAQRATRRMQTVVEDLLALAREESAAAAADRADPVRLDCLVADAVRDSAPLATHRGILLDVRPLEPVTVMGDHGRLLDAVTNVVVNAIYYNVDDGRVRIALEAGPDTAVVRIADTGVGIAADALPRIFEPFFRGDPARSRAAGGSGLGLAVTMAVVERHRGRITCISEPGRGTEVVIELPVAPALRAGWRSGRSRRRPPARTHPDDVRRRAKSPAQCPSTRCGTYGSSSRRASSSVSWMSSAPIA